MRPKIPTTNLTLVKRFAKQAKPPRVDIVMNLQLIARPDIDTTHKAKVDWCSRNLEDMTPAQVLSAWDIFYAAYSKERWPFLSK